MSDRKPQLTKFGTFLAERGDDDGDWIVLPTVLSFVFIILAGAFASIGNAHGYTEVNWVAMVAVGFAAAGLLPFVVQLALVIGLILLNGIVRGIIHQRSDFDLIAWVFGYTWTDFCKDDPVRHMVFSGLMLWVYPTCVALAMFYFVPSLLGGLVALVIAYFTAQKIFNFLYDAKQAVDGIHEHVHSNQTHEKEQDRD